VELLRRLPEQALIPQAVAEELSVAPEGDPARLALDSGLFTIIDSPVTPESILAWDLGKGESAVLSYALANPEFVAVLDDGTARRCARSFSITVTGTLAIVILARQHGLIKSAVQVLQALRGVDFRLDDVLIHDALARTVGEKWKTKK
jgi:predicted nucleic acid-binding protein